MLAGQARGRPAISAMGFIQGVKRAPVLIRTDEEGPMIQLKVGLS